MNLYPLIFKPIYKNKIWGGNKLKTFFGRDLSEEYIGESWEIAAHSNGTSVIKNGPLAEKDLDLLIQENKEQLLGKYLAQKNNTFPLLVKFLSIRNKLSIQVHPDDLYAQKKEGEPGKTEMWYILDASPKARLIYGLKPKINKERFIEAIKKGNPEDCLNYIRVKPGDFFFIPAGTIHSIKGEMLLAEIQQNSDTTYRVYDWQRTDSRGKSRQLHIEQALDVIREQPESRNLPVLKSTHCGVSRKLLVACPHFITEKVDLNNNSLNLNPAGETFYIIINLKGRTRFSSHNLILEAGQTALIPAECEKTTITGNCKFLLSYVAPRKEWLIDNLTRQGYEHSRLSSLVARTF